jgi:hypothetical protein
MGFYFSIYQSGQRAVVVSYLPGAASPHVAPAERHLDCMLLKVHMKAKYL